MDKAKLLASVGWVIVWTTVARGFTQRFWTAAIAGLVVSGAELLILSWGGRDSDLILPLVIQAGTTVGLLVVWGVLAAAKARQAAGARIAVSAPRTPIARLWTGDASPLQAFACLAVLVLALFFLMGAGLTVSMHRSPRAVAAGIVVAWLLAAAGVFWWICGAWRIARREASLGGWRKLAAWVLRFTVIGAVLVASSVGIADAWPQVREYTVLALGPSERTLYSIRVLRNGHELEFSGTLGFGAGEDVEAALTANPNVHVLHLNSTGGRAFEGERIAAIVQRRGLVTYVANECESACVDAFVAGAERLVSRRASFGLHQGTSPGMTTLARERFSRQGVERLVQRGVDRAFAERGYRTPPEKMWRPTRDEVLAAKLATREARAGEVALSGVSGEALSKLDLHLRESPLFEALFEFERPLFDRVVSALRDGYARGLSEDEAIPFFGQAFAEILGR